MKAYVQWLLQHPTDWVQIDSANWAALPSKPAPTGLVAPDDVQGWIFALNVQGVIFEADHFSIQDIPNNGIVLAISNDNQFDYPAGLKYARVWTFFPRTSQTPQSQAVYAQATFQARIAALGPLQDTTLSDYTLFVAPAANIIRHRIRISPSLIAQHRAAQTLHTVDEWP